LREGVERRHSAVIRVVVQTPKSSPDAARPLYRRYSGLFDAIRIRKAGYSYRIPHALFLKRYAFVRRTLSDLWAEGRSELRDVCDQLLRSLSHLDGAIAAHAGERALGVAGWRVGKTKVFLRTGTDRQAIEEVRLGHVARLVVRIQAMARGFAIRRKANADKWERRERERKAMAEIAKQAHAIAALQSRVRGWLIRRDAVQRALLRDLGRACDAGDLDALERTLPRMDAVFGSKLRSFRDKAKGESFFDWLRSRARRPAGGVGRAPRALWWAAASVNQRCVWVRSIARRRWQRRRRRGGRRRRRGRYDLGRTGRRAGRARAAQARAAAQGGDAARGHRRGQGDARPRQAPAAAARGAASPHARIANEGSPHITNEGRHGVSERAPRIFPVERGRGSRTKERRERLRRSVPVSEDVLRSRTRDNAASRKD
jgi:hypothetical protein